jgi:2-C-methyl-D-erythritol 4-phosphate cytidylyltransferase
MSSSTWGIIVASGKGEKFAPDIDTSFLNLGSKPVLTYSLAAYEHCPEVDGLVIVAPKERLENVKILVQMFGCYKVKKIVAGTVHRQSSVLNGLHALDEGVAIVSIHDASRPNITPEQIAETIKTAKRYGSGVLASRLSEAVKVVDKGTTVTDSLNGGNLWLVQTPQAFKTEVILKGYEAAQKKKASLSDDSQALSLIRADIHLVANEKSSVRIAGPSDLQLAEFLLRH